MAEEEKLIEWRVAKVEVDVRDIKTELTAMRECQIKTNSSLDSLLVGFGELKQAVTSINDKPKSYWEKFVYAVIVAGVGIVVGLFVK